MITKSDSVQIIPDIKKYQRDLSKDAPEWINGLRNQGLNRFNEQGIPGIKDEEWKYTNLSALTERHFIPAPAAKISDKNALFAYSDKAEINIVLINGLFAPELSNLTRLPKGITITALSETLTKDNAAKALFTSHKAQSEDSFIALNTALMRDGVFIKVDDKVVTKGLIHIIHVSSTTENTVVFPRSLITLGKSSEAVILESHIGLSDSCYFADPVSDIFLAEDAKLLYCKAQGAGKKSIHIGTTRVHQKRDSQFHGFSLMTGAKLTRNNLNIILAGEGASATLNGLYVIAEDQHVDNHTLVDHTVPNCTSNQLYKGILHDNARAVFNGKIFVRPIAQGTNSYQLNKNLLLGKGCRVDTKPQLEIFADDVKCTHGATIGQLNEDEVFYLQTRAIPKDTAIQMLARGFVDDILNTIPNGSICHKLNTLLAPTFVGTK